jgi:hypothetical protein
MSDDTKESTSWFTIIPEFFYEVIGRIIPGGTFIFGLTYIINQAFLFAIFKKQINGTEVNPTLIFIVLLGFSYSLGYFLTPFGHHLGKFFYFKRQLKKKFNECPEKHCKWLLEKANLEAKSVKDPNHKKGDCVKDLTSEQIELLFQCQHDQIRINRPDLIRSLSKSQADVQSCINTYAAFFIIVIVLAIIGVIPPPNNVCSLLAVGFLFAACYRNKRFLERQFSFSKIAQEKEKGEKEKLVGLRGWNRKSWSFWSK